MLVNRIALTCVGCLFLLSALQAADNNHDPVDDIVSLATDKAGWHVHNQVTATTTTHDTVEGYQESTTQETQETQETRETRETRGKRGTHKWTRLVLEHGELSTTHLKPFLSLMGQMELDEQRLASIKYLKEQKIQEQSSLLKEIDRLTKIFRMIQEQLAIDYLVRNVLEEDERDTPDLIKQRHTLRNEPCEEALKMALRQASQIDEHLVSLDKELANFGEASITAMFVGLADIGFQKGTEYKVFELIGQGACSHVYRAQDSHGKLVTLKVFTADYSQGLFVNELRMHAWMMSGEDSTGYRNHVIQLRSIIVNKNGLPFTTDLPILVFEYMEQDLHHFLSSRRGRTAVTNHAFIWKLMKALLEACAYFETKDMLHGDLKPGNVLITFRAVMDFDIRIIDFGLTVVLTGVYYPALEHIYTYGFRPMEVYLRGPIEFNADVYAVGEFFLDIWGQTGMRTVEPMIAKVLQRIGRSEESMHFAQSIINRFGYSGGIALFLSWKAPEEYAKLERTIELVRSVALHVLGTDLLKWIAMAPLSQIRGYVNQHEYAFYMQLTQPHPQDRPNAQAALSSPYMTRSFNV